MLAEFSNWDGAPLPFGLAYFELVNQDSDWVKLVILILTLHVLS